jgi:competence protein ComEA
MDELMEKAREVLQENLLAAGLGIVGFVLLLYGLIAYVGVGQKEEAVVFSAEDDKADQKSDKDESAMLVDVAGAVMKPGVYKVKDGSRFQDAILAAGGMSPDADAELIAKQLNLAAKLADGVKVYVPFKGEVMGSTTHSASSGQVGSLININVASAKELDSLPGIGPVTSEKIIGSRPYSVIDELVKKKVVTQRVFEQIKEKIAVY